MKIGKTTHPIKDKNQLKWFFLYLKEHDPVMFILAAIIYYTAFRVGDVRYLTVKAIKTDMLEVNERKTRYKERQHKQDLKESKKNPRKAKKTRKVPIEKVLRRHIERHISGKANYEYLFPSPQKRQRAKGEPISYWSIENRLKKAARAVGLNEKEFGTHALRKTSIWEVYQKYGIVAAQAYAGHESVEQTQVYLGINQELANQGAKAISNILDEIPLD